MDILSFIDQIQRWHNMLTAHDILVKLESIRGLSSKNKEVQEKVVDLMLKIEEQYGDLTLPSK